MRLAIHLENEETLLFRGNSKPSQVVAKERMTTLKAWFKSNQREKQANDPKGCHLLYPDYVTEYTFDKSKREWKQKRIFWTVEARCMYSVWSSIHTVLLPTWKTSPFACYKRMPKDASVGRMYFVSPRAGEKYFMRLLLCHVAGATSFEDLRTVEDEVHTTYQSACVARGLLQDDKEWDRCIQEANDCGFMPDHLMQSTSFVNYLNYPFGLSFFCCSKESLSRWIALPTTSSFICCHLEFQPPTGTEKPLGKASWSYGTRLLLQIEAHRPRLLWWIWQRVVQSLPLGHWPNPQNPRDKFDWVQRNAYRITIRVELWYVCDVLASSGISRVIFCVIFRIISIKLSL